MVNKITTAITPTEEVAKINEIIDDLGKTASFNLFDWKWTDYELADQSWLKADTFSWQDGTVYSDAYNHLTADYSGGTSKTETIGSHTITFVEATDGHRITTDESTVADIYTESGVAWFYVLDTANQRFKLPRSTHGEIVEKYQSGTEWYRVYSDGWCEQGGLKTASGASGTATVSLLKEMSNTNYNILITTQQESSIGNGGGSVKRATLSVSSFDYGWASMGLTGFYWEVKGYVSSYPSKGQYKYLYFYVGQFSQSATEQTAGLNAELFNGKVDLPSGVSQSSCDFVVESQLPNAGNNYTWYRLYKSGWVEQGGRINRGLTNNEVVTIDLPVAYEDTNYTVTTSTFRISGTNSPTDNKAALISDMATDSFSVKNTRFEGYFSFMWEAKGMKASS
ncbi:MAG: hypothetical protein J6S85_03905 [Methanobrevibacter sp.]|nr:hypothetical protein [Methanobrevibacter sp.]MBO7712687.1 hypothetical protein [Methanobrevibacter sp.]